MREVFQQELADVQSGLVAISKDVHSAITRATAAFNHSDVGLADQVISDDLKIDESTLRVDDLGVEILLMQSPVARDLRFIVATMRITAALERMGDLAAHIAQLARLRYPEASAPADLRDRFTRVGELDVAQAERVVRLLETEESDLIDEIIEADDAVDAIHKEVLEFLTQHEQAGDIPASQIVDATLANRYFERFSDHAVSIARRMRYMQEGSIEDIEPGE
ncbi:phosphate signaling complex protein PhoU [Gulosibacter molinativorax]|uniref:Phosphate-specific transport system accessory protein PhoU n=1 Tax=Gulosibacter molinativorax TaxID=256821 RepID=A0ABT7C403_9MICO|nr:phosphate signaling complex protein PhoU [Gulosibacter molinativorax]MDJ1369955.1 phosphate transport system regulatory protein PhoU [Gulosibacter molinativorax]QUY63856.1 Phosphate-specific transport system accessory protein PhoU [Gulosibacter molinativorax]